MVISETMQSGTHRFRFTYSLALVCLLGALICFAQVLLLAWHGDPFILLGTRVSHAKDRVIGGAFALLGFFVFRGGLKKSRRQWILLGGRTALVLVSLVVALILSELLLRHYLRHTQGFFSMQLLNAETRGDTLRVRNPHALSAIVRLSPNPRLIYDLTPDKKMRFGGRSLFINRHGCRDSGDYTVAKPDGVKRIIGIGDSGMFGWGVHQDEDYLSALESNLNVHSAGPRYEVLNMAVPGYNTQQEVETLRAKGLRFSPDIVIVGWCANDYDVPFFLLQRKTFNRRDISYLYTLLFRRTLFRELVRPATVDLRHADDAIWHPDVRAGVGEEGVRVWLGKLRDLSREHGFRVLVFGPMKEHIVSLCEELGLAYYNTYKEIPRGTYPREHYIHFIHPSADGHAALAEHLEVALRAKGWIPEGPGGT